MRVLLVAALLCTTWSPLALAEDEPTTYICKTEQTTGFSYKNGVWKPQNEWKQSTFVLQYMGGMPEKSYWVLTRLGFPLALADCDDSYLDSSKKKRVRGPLITCTGISEMEMNTTTRAFIYSNIQNFVDDFDQENTTPTLSIGKCSPF